MPPPLSAKLPEIVLSLTVTLPPLMPPPSRSAEFPEIVLLVIVTSPRR